MKEELYLIQDDTMYAKPLPKLTAEEERKLEEDEKRIHEEICKEFGL